MGASRVYVDFMWHSRRLELLLQWLACLKHDIAILHIFTLKKVAMSKNRKIKKFSMQIIDRAK
jgi:hypothetical protein